jgi:hypothetical protein
MSDSVTKWHEMQEDSTPSVNKYNIDNYKKKAAYKILTEYDLDIIKLAYEIGKLK